MFEVSYFKGLWKKHNQCAYANTCVLTTHMHTPHMHTYTQGKPIWPNLLSSTNRWQSVEISLKCSPLEQVCGVERCIGVESGWGGV